MNPQSTTVSGRCCTMRGGEGGDGRTDRARSASLGQNGATERASDQMRQMETPIIESDGWTDADARAPRRMHFRRVGRRRCHPPTTTRLEFSEVNRRSFRAFSQSIFGQATGKTPDKNIRTPDVPRCINSWMGATPTWAIQTILQPYSVQTRLMNSYP